jgi:fructokinase
VGCDDLGDRALAQIASLGVATSHIQRDDTHPTGTVNVFFDADNSPDYYIVPDVAYDHVEATDDALAAAAAADCLCFGTLSQRSLAARQTLGQLLEERKPDTVTLLDINLRKDCYTPETVGSSLSEADLVKLNDDEAFVLAGMLGLAGDTIDGIGKALVEQYALDGCVVTLGPKGAFACSANGETSYVPGFEATLVDSLGAGDAFAAGFIHKYLRGRPLAECCFHGNVMGAIVASQLGATHPASADDIAAFVASGTRRIPEPVLLRFAAD